MASQATRMARESSAATESEIAAVACQLWLDNGCPTGKDREHWFHAEAMLRRANASRWKDPSGCPLASGLHGTPESEAAIEFPITRWDGHWEAWEREWGGARWIWDVRGAA